MASCVLPLLINAFLFAQIPGVTLGPQEPAAIAGEIIDESSGQPIPWVRVVARPHSAMAGTSATGDELGHFSFSGLQPGRYDLTAKRNGFLQKNLILSLAPGQRLEKITVSMTPQAVIAGRVEDQDGWPVGSTHVQALRYGYQNGRRQLRPVGTAETNDLGEYRIANLPAGRYYIRAAAPFRLTEFDERYTVGYYPGTLDAREDNQVEVRTGQELGDVTIPLPKRSGVMIRGRVLMQAASDELERGYIPTVVLEPGDPILDNGIRTTLWSWRSDDTFSLRYVPPGDYVLKVAVPGPISDIPKFLARKTLWVGDSDIEDVVLDLQPVVPQDILGTITFESGSGPERVMISLQPVGRSTIQTTSKEDGTFMLRALGPGKYQLSAYGMRGSSMKAAHLGDNEVINGEFELDGRAAGPLNLTMATMGIFRVQGVVLDSGRRPAAGALVWLVPTFSAPRGVRLITTADQEGSFSIAGPAGEYRLFVIGDSVPFDSLEDPEFQKAHEKNSRILTLTEGVNPPLTLVLTPTK